MRETRTATNTVALIVSPALILITVVLTYTTDVFSSFHGSWLVILGWFTLATAFFAAFAARNDPGRAGRLRATGLARFGNSLFIAGVSIILISVTLAVWAYHMFDFRIPWLWSS